MRNSGCNSLGRSIYIYQLRRECGIKNAKLAGSAQTGSQPCSTVGECFIAGTFVETEHGLKPIEEVEVGEKVLAYDEETGEQAYKPVVRLFRNKTEEWYHIHVNG